MYVLYFIYNFYIKLKKKKNRHEHSRNIRYITPFFSINHIFIATFIIFISTHTTRPALFKFGISLFIFSHIKLLINPSMVHFYIFLTIRLI
jgi:hypothetical protein